MEIEIAPGIEEYKWKSPNIEDFIKKAKNIVDSLYEIVKKMKDSLKNIHDNLEFFNKPILERKNRPTPPDEYIN